MKKDHTKKRVEISSSEQIAKDYTNHIVQKVPDLISVIYYGGSLTGKHRNNRLQPDIDLIVVTKRDNIEPETKTHLDDIAQDKNIDAFWEPVSWGKTDLAGEYFHTIKEYKVLFGIDYLAKYYNAERYE